MFHYEYKFGDLKRIIKNAVDSPTPTWWVERLAISKPGRRKLSKDKNFHEEAAGRVSILEFFVKHKERL
jgi:hypothetical protein